LKNGVILIGSSLGGIFLARHLSENIFPKKIKAVILVAPPFNNSLSDEDLVGGFKLKGDLSLIEKNCKNIYFLFSSDDTCVPLEHAYKYRKKLPRANFVICDKANGHFKISQFPEIVKVIKSLI
jgi:predicted alpha/beta hydrolase family esterase